MKRLWHNSHQCEKVPTVPWVETAEETEEPHASEMSLSLLSSLGLRLGMDSPLII